MSEEEKKKTNVPESPMQISRREFAKSSMAILSAYSLSNAATAPPLSPEAQAMKLEISNEVQSFLEVRHILEDDVKRVIDHAEKTGQKLYQPGSPTYLSKLRVQEVYFYVEYSPAKEGYQIHSAYSHRFLLTGDP